MTLTYMVPIHHSSFHISILCHHIRVSKKSRRPQRSREKHLAHFPFGCFPTDPNFLRWRSTIYIKRACNVKWILESVSSPV